MNGRDIVKAVPSALDSFVDAELREKLHQRSTELWNQLVHNHGMAAMAAPRCLAVCHEVGHAVLNTAHGVEVDSIEVWGKTVVQMLQEEKGRPIREIERKRLRAAGFDLHVKNWCGYTTAGKSPFVTDQSGAGAYNYVDLDHTAFAHAVQSTIAGILGEEIYYTAMTGKKVPAGSSLDEIMRAQLACQCRANNEVEVGKKLFDGLWKLTGKVLIRDQTLARRLIAAMQNTDKLEGSALKTAIQATAA